MTRASSSGPAKTMSAPVARGPSTRAARSGGHSAERWFTSKATRVPCARATATARSTARRGGSAGRDAGDVQDGRRGDQLRVRVALVQPGTRGTRAVVEQDPRDQNGNVIYDRGVTLLDTWKAMESLVDHGRCRAIGLSDITFSGLLPIYESARIKPAVIQVESHPYLPETQLLEFCRGNGIVFLAFAPLGHGARPGPLEDPVVTAIAARVGKTPAQALLAWAVQRGSALLTTPRSAARAAENFNICPLPEDAFDEINRIQTRQRLNDVVNTGSPGFIPRVRAT